MQQITGITSEAAQSFTVPLTDGTKLAVAMRYLDQNFGWYFTSLNWNNGQWKENGRRIVSHPNMLRQYRNILTFGLACFTVNNREPYNIQDFSSGASNLYILSTAEVAAFESYLQKVKIAQVPS